jgi:hypothetical protein
MTHENPNAPDVTTAIVPVEPEKTGVSQNEWLKQHAISLAKSSLIPKHLRGHPADIWLILSMGQELGISPALALSSIHVIEGKPTLSADLMVAVTKSRGVCQSFRLIESTEERATYEAHRVGDPEPTRLTFTLEDAKKLDLLGKHNWKKQPKTMLRKRCKAALCREVFEDILAGFYDPEELERTRAEAVPRGVEGVKAALRAKKEIAS